MTALCLGHESKVLEEADEFSFRLNEGNVRNHTTQRLDSLIRRSAGKRLTLEALTNA